MSKGLERRKAILSDPVAQFERAVEIREFENQVNALFASGTIRGTTHLCLGQEALAIGLASVLRTDDQVSATYRSHGIALALGLTTESAMAEIMGKATGCCGGLGGSMHLFDLELGLLPTSAIIGGGMPIAAGVALAFQVQGNDRVAVAIFGDGATNIGAFHETLINLTTPIEDLHIRAESYAMPHYALDGMDIDVVREGIQSAVDRARSGGGPTLIEAKTYRFAGHSRADQALYRPEGELDSWKSRDPLLLLEERAKKIGKMTDAQVADMKTRIAKEIEATVALCQSAPEPSPKTMFENIWSRKVSQ